MTDFFSRSMQGRLIVFAQPLKDGVQRLEPKLQQKTPTMIPQPMIAQLSANVRAQVNTALPHNGVCMHCSAHVHGITNPVHYARNQARQQQAEEAERGQHREKQLAGAACFLNVREGRPTTYEDVKHYLRRMSRSAGGESEHYPQSLRTLSKNEAWLSAEDELVWARERFRADCAARAIRTCEDAEWHYTRIRDARAAVVRAECIWMYIE